MTTNRLAPSCIALAIAALVLAAPAAAQHGTHAHGHHDVPMPTSGLRAELVRDIESLEKRYLALAEAMTGKFGWRPAAGVRSVGEVFMHVAGANFMLPTMVGHQPPQEMRRPTQQETMTLLQSMEKETDEAKIREALQHSFMHARHAVASVPDAQLDAMTKMFGRDVTKRVVLNLLVSHMHEHLGQSVAYARSNGVTPPWSAGEG